MDLSQDGLTKVIFVDESNNIVAADVYGCHCQTLLATTAQDTKGTILILLNTLGVAFYEREGGCGGIIYSLKCSKSATAIIPLIPYLSATIQGVLLLRMTTNN